MAMPAPEDGLKVGPATRSGAVLSSRPFPLETRSKPGTNIKPPVADAKSSHIRSPSLKELRIIRVILSTLYSCQIGIDVLSGSLRLNSDLDGMKERGDDRDRKST